MNMQDLREAVNPVFNTAKSCVQLNAAVGDKDAQLLLDALGFGAFGAQQSKKPVPKEMLEQVKRLFPAYTILVESRFKSINRLIEQRGGTMVADLPCGYTSRGIRLSRQGRAYAGLDLPAVADVMGPAVESIIGKSNTVAYYAVDATNYESLKKAFFKDDHNLLVTTEGLLMYFVQSELEEVFANVRRLLKDHGGSWVITDRAYFLHDQEVVAAALDNDRDLMALYAAITSQAAATTADVKFNDNVFFDPDDAKVREFITKMGFELHEICMADYLPDQIVSLKGTPEVDAAVRDVFKKMMIWELTPTNAADEKPVDDKAPFMVTSELRDGTFEVSIQGRLDTITSPELLKRFQDAGEGIEAIRLDVSQMPYISSAGLRVLLIMYKSLENSDNFKLSGVKKEVREILETTGMDEFLLR